MGQVDLLKLHYQRKKKLAKQFNVTEKKIQIDTDIFIEYLKTLNSEQVSRTELLAFCESYPNTFYYQLIDWGEPTDPQFATIEDYRNAQIDIIISDKSIVFSSENEMVQITPIED